MGAVDAGAVVVESDFGVETSAGEEIDVADVAGGEALAGGIIDSRVAEDGILVGFDGLAVFVGEGDDGAEAVEVVIIAGGVLADDVPVAGEDVGVDIVDDAVVVEVGPAVEAGVLAAQKPCIPHDVNIGHCRVSVSIDVHLRHYTHPYRFVNAGAIKKGAGEDAFGIS